MTTANVQAHPPVSTSPQRWRSTLCCSAGLALSVYLALLKFFSLPCIGPGGCHAVIHSSYGTVAGLPVGVFGALLWGAAILVPDDTKRRALLLLLAGGSACFMGIQFFLLHSFCLYCTLHAVAALLAVTVGWRAPHRAALVLGLVLAGAGFAATRAFATKQVQASVDALPTTVNTLASDASAMPWLGPVLPDSPAVVLSLNCPACLELLEQLTRTSLKDVAGGPALFFKTTDDNRDLTTAFVASILASPASKREAFIASVSILLTMQDHALSSPQTAAAQFSGMTPMGASQRDHAARLLEEQRQALVAAKLSDTTPLLVPRDGKPKAFFSIDELFRRQP